LLDEEEYWARLAYEAELMRKEEPTFEPVNGDIRRWRGYIIGTGIYEGGVFEIEIEVTRRFPFEPPIVKFLTKIWHPNIHPEQQRVCIGILGKDWSPSITLTGVVEAIRMLLNAPNPHDPLNREAAEQLLRDPKAFEKKAREWVKKYARWDKIYQKK